MTLRNDIRAAIDEVAPPAPALEHRVAYFVFADQKTRKQLTSRPRQVSTRLFQSTLALVAAAIVISLVAGLFLAGRFWRNENQPAQTISQTALKRLESKALQFPTVAAGAPCPQTPLTLKPAFGMVIGDGPVYLGNGDIFENGDWGGWVSLGFIYDTSKPGLVLVRARDLKNGAEVAFAHYPLSPTGVSAVGAVLGTAHVVNHNVQLRSEAAFQDSFRPHSIDKSGQAPELVVLFGMQKGSSGCIGFQVDGPGFSETFVLMPAVPGF